MMAAPTRAQSSATAIPFFGEDDGGAEGGGVLGERTGVAIGASKGALELTGGSPIGDSTGIATTEVADAGEGSAERTASGVNRGWGFVDISPVLLRGASGTVTSGSVLGAMMAFPQHVQNFCPWARGAPQEVQKF